MQRLILLAGSSKIDFWLIWFECDRLRFHVTAKHTLVCAAIPLPKMFSLGQINTEAKWVKTEYFFNCVVNSYLTMG